MRNKIYYFACVFLLFTLLPLTNAEAFTYDTSLPDSQGNYTLGDNNVRHAYVYNADLDADQGAWRKDLHAQKTSWFGETCAQPCTRGKETDFPRYAYLVVTDASLDIINAESHMFWMRFNKAANNMLDSSTITGVVAHDGKIFVTSTSRLTVLDFVLDKAFYYSTVNKFSSKTAIEGRNRNASWTPEAVSQIASNDVHDVSIATIAGLNYLALATATGVSVINEATDQVHNYYSASSSDNINKVALNSDGSLYFSNQTTGEIDVFYNIQGDSSDQGTPAAKYSTSSLPALQENVNATVYPLKATVNTSTIGPARNTIYVGSSKGVAVINEGPIGSENTGSVKYFTKDYITEEMPGSVRGTWTFEEAAGNFLDKSGKGNNLSVNSGINRSASGVRGYGISFTSSSSQYLSQNYNANFDFGTGCFSITGWFKQGSTAGGQVKIIDRTDGIRIGYQLYIDTAGKLGGRVSDDGSNWDTVQSISSVDNNNWTQFALVWAPGSALTLYVNGIEAAHNSGLVTSGSISGTNAVLNIGRDHSGAEYFNGGLDELMVTGAALTPQNAWAIYSKSNAARISPYPKLLSGTTNEVADLNVTRDGRIMWVGTNDNVGGGAVSVIKLGMVGNYVTQSNIDVQSADSNINNYTTASVPPLRSNDVTAVAAIHSAGREYLFVGSLQGAASDSQGTDWYLASDSYIHGGLINTTGPCKSSPSYQICDSLGQVASSALASTNYQLFDGYQYDDRDAPDGPVIIGPQATTDVTPTWQWAGVYDRSGVDGYYIRIGTSVNGDDFIAKRWLGNVTTWTQDLRFQRAGMYYLQLRVRDKVGNEGAWGPITSVLVITSLNFYIEGVPAGTLNLGSGLLEKETTDISTDSDTVDFGILSIHTPKIGAHKLTISTNVGQGYMVTVEHDGPMRTVLQNQDTIDPFSAPNSTPTYWASTTGGVIGYHTDFVTLHDVGNGPARFRGFANKYAGLSTLPEEIMYSGTAVFEDKAYVLYKIEISPSLLPGLYQNQITYFATATY